MRILKEVLIIGFWIIVGAMALWGFDRAGLLSSERNGGSMATLQVDFPEVYQLWKKGEAIFVDARPASAFQREHIPGAVNVPVNRVEQGLKALPEDRNARLITYCGSVECPNAYQLMQALLRYGYRNVQFFPRGIRGWQALGYPLKKGSPTEVERKQDIQSEHNIH
ncbi:MAG: rhodanese-like domain-containing protein [Candidatus Poribacteria bacterium]